MALHAHEAFLTVALLSAASVARAGDDFSSLLKKTLDAYGGEAALSKVTALRATGKVSSAMRTGAQGTMVRVFARPQRLRVEIAYPNEPVEVRVLDGARGWRHGAEVQGPPLDAMVLQAARLALPLLLVEYKGQLKDGGLVEHDGAKLRAVEVSLGGSMVITALIDPTSGLIMHSSGKAKGGPMPIEFGSSYSDFRKVQGIVVPFKERTVAMGQFTGETTLDTVEVLATVPKEAFVP